MSESARTPLLGGGRDGGSRSSNGGRRSGDEGLQGSTSSRSGPTLSVVAKMLGALSAGRLPSNDQLYALLHRAAGFLDGLGSAVPHNVDAERYRDNQGDDEPEAMVGDDTAIHLATMLKESAALARQLARWVYGQSDDQQGRRGATSTAPAGNSNEQMQRFIFHFSQILNSRPVEVDVDADIQGGLKDAAEATKEAAKQAKEDAVGGTKALVQIVSLIIGSDELRRLPSDVVRYLRSSLAQGAERVETRVADVKDALQGPTGQGGGEVQDEKNKDFVAPADAVEEARQGAEKTAEAALQLGQAETAPKSKDERAFEWRDEIVGRIARLIEALQSDPGYANAVSVLLEISQRYAEIIDGATEEVKSAVEQTRPQETSANEQGDTVEHVKNLGEHGLEQAQGAVEATLSSTKMDGQINVRASHHALEAGRAACEVIEGLAGGKSMGPILDAAKILRDTAYEDGALRQWLDDVGKFAQRTIAAAVESHNDADGHEEDANFSTSLQMKSEEAQKELHSLVARFEDLVSTRPALLQAMDELKRQVADMIDAVLSDVAIERLQARFNRVLTLARQTFLEGARDAYQTGSHLTSLLLKALLPSLGDILGSVPIPRVEFASDSVDAVVEDVVVPLVQLIPDSVRVQTSQDWLWQRHTPTTTAANNVDTTWKVHVGGLQLALSDISFFVEEKATAPDADSCGGCCGCYVRRDSEAASSTSCICQGPASWFAYREKAILDVGVYEPGLGLEIDLEDAGSHLSSSIQAGKRKKGTKSARLNDQEGLDDMIADRRRRFFNVRDVTLTSAQSIHYKLRNSRHWLINAIVVAASRPLVRLVLRRLVSAQVTHAVEQLDELVYDYHFRAKRLASRSATRRADVAALPSWNDYVRVLTNAEAGKSRARVRKERKEKEEEEIRRKREEEEAAEEEAMQQQRQPGPSKTMGVKPTSIIRHDPNGSYSLAIGVKPGRGVLSADKRGPTTRHTALRDDIIEGQWKKLAERPVKGAQRTWEDTRDQAGLSNVGVQNSIDGVRDNIAAVKQAKQEVEQTRDGLIEEQQQQERAQTQEHNDEAWKSSAFDL